MSCRCITCKKFVNKRQKALLCDGCNKWKHRTCNSGVSRETYRDAVKSGVDIPWKCESCSASRAILPNFDSTRNEGKKDFHCYLWGKKAGKWLVRNSIRRKASKIVKLKTFLFKN